jgi:hypothetical protein
MAINRTGFEILNTGLQISKDPAAQLTYTLSWSEWLENSDTISSVAWSAAARRNDPTPLVIESSGVDGTSTQTYVELSGGQDGKTYIITATINTVDGLTDARNFRVVVESRAA